MADLSITNTVNRTTAAPGDVLIYTTTVKNNGPDTATGITLTNDINMPTEYSTDGGATYSPWPGHITLSNMTNGESRTYTFRGTVPVSASGSQIKSAAGVTAGNDSNTGNNTAPAVTTDIPAAVPGADLAIDNQVDRTLAAPGDVLNYTTKITNNGPNQADNVVLSNNTTLLNPQYSIDGGQTYNPWVGQLALGNFVNGETRTVMLRGTIPADAVEGSRIANAASVASTTPDSVPTNNTSTTNTTVVSPREACAEDRRLYDRATGDINQIAKDIRDADTIDEDANWLEAAIARNSSPSELLNINSSISDSMNRLINNNTRIADRLDAALATRPRPECPPTASATAGRTDALNGVLNAIAEQETASANLSAKEADKNTNVLANANATMNDVLDIGKSVADVLNKEATNTAVLTRMVSSATRNMP